MPYDFYSKDGADASFAPKNGVLDGGTAAAQLYDIRIRHDDSAGWAAEDPVLSLGEEGIDTDTGVRKVGDGVTVWSSLPASGGGGGGTSVHGDLTGRNTADQHPIAAITGLQDALDALAGASGGSTVTADDTPAAPAEGESATYFVTSAVTWPVGLVWSTDPDGDVAPTIVEAALVSMFTLDGVTRAVMGATFPAPVIPDTTPPSIPAGLSAVAASHTSITLSWTASTDDTAVTGYEYRVDAGTAVDAGAGVSELVTGLTAATEYDFEVRAYDAAGNLSGWSTVATETTDAAADVTAPTVGTLAGSAITDTSFTLTVTGASDNVALHATPYAFSTNGGSSYSAWQAGATFAASGLTASTGYSCRHKVRDAALNESTGAAITVTTDAPLSTVVLTDTVASQTVADTGQAYYATTGRTAGAAMSFTAPAHNGVQPSATAMTDFDLEFDWTPVSAGSAVVYYMGNNADSGSRAGFALYSNGSQPNWFGVAPTVGLVSPGWPIIVVGTTYRIKIQVRGLTITVFGDGVQRNQGTFTQPNRDSLVAPTWVQFKGFIAVNSFDNIVVTSFP